MMVLSIMLLGRSNACYSKVFISQAACQNVVYELQAEQR